MSKSMNYEVAACKLFQGEWLVEAIDYDGDVYMTRFSGPEAQARANEYAQWKQERP